MPGGARKGNQNAKRGSEWRDAVTRAIWRGKSLDKLADTLVTKALEGDMVALREIGDRLDGKPKQTVDMTLGDTQIQGPNADTLASRLAAGLAGRAGTESSTDTIQ